MQYGLITGMGLVILSLLFYFIDVNPESKVHFLIYLIILIGIIFGVINYKKTCNLNLNYGKAFSTGLMISVFASLILAFYTYIFYKFIDPDAIDKIIKMAEQNIILNKKIPKEQVAISIQMMKKMTTVNMVSLLTIPSVSINGLLMSLIAAIFLKSRNK